MEKVIIAVERDRGIIVYIQYVSTLFMNLISLQKNHLP